MRSRTFKRTTESLSHQGERLEPPCGVFVDLCALRLWQTQPDGKLTRLGDPDARIVFAALEPLFHRKSKLPAGPCLVTFDEAARRVGIKPKTLYNFKSSGRLRAEHGFRKVGRSNRIDLKVFMACIERGGLS